MISKEKLRNNVGGGETTTPDEAGAGGIASRTNNETINKTEPEGPTRREKQKIETYQDSRRTERLDDPRGVKHTDYVDAGAHGVATREHDRETVTTDKSEERKEDREKKVVGTSFAITGDEGVNHLGRNEQGAGAPTPSDVDDDIEEASNNTAGDSTPGDGDPKDFGFGEGKAGDPPKVPDVPDVPTPKVPDLPDLPSGRTLLLIATAAIGSLIVATLFAAKEYVGFMTPGGSG